MRLGERRSWNAWVLWAAAFRAARQAMLRVVRALTMLGCKKAWNAWRLLADQRAHAAHRSRGAPPVEYIPRLYRP